MRRFHTYVPAAVALLLAGCQDLGPIGETTVLSIVPTGGATGVDPNASIVIDFTHAIGPGMEQYVALHEGDVTGPLVPGSSTWTSDRTQLTFVPDDPLKPGIRYTIHLGGGMRDGAGNLLSFEHCASQHGGQWATQPMMGAGWRHANGTFGMVFTFLTGE